MGTVKGHMQFNDSNLLAFLK